MVSFSHFNVHNSRNRFLHRCSLIASVFNTIIRVGDHLSLPVARSGGLDGLLGVGLLLRLGALLLDGFLIEVRAALTLECFYYKRVEIMPSKRVHDKRLLECLNRCDKLILLLQRIVFSLGGPYRAYYVSRVTCG